MWARAFAAAAGLCLATPAISQMAPPPQPDIAIDTLEVWDDTISKLTVVAWTFYTAATVRSPDVVDSALARELSEHILAPKAKKRIDALRARAAMQSAAGDTGGLKRTLEEATPLIHEQLYRAWLGGWYMQARDMLAYHQRIMAPWLERVTEADRKTVADQVAAASVDLNKKFSVLLKSTTYTTEEASGIFKSALPAVDHLNSERQILVAAQAALPNPIDVGQRMRTAECPESATTLSESGKPALGQNFPSSDGFYPRAAQVRDVTGSVVLEASIAATGCIESVKVVGSSGSSELDTGALDMAMAASYVPAAQNGVAVPGTLTFRVKFALR